MECFIKRIQFLGFIIGHKTTCKADNYCLCGMFGLAVAALKEHLGRQHSLTLVELCEWWMLEGAKLLSLYEWRMFKGGQNYDHYKLSCMNGGMLEGQNYYQLKWHHFPYKASAA